MVQSHKSVMVIRSNPSRTNQNQSTFIFELVLMRARLLCEAFAGTMEHGVI